MKDKIETTGLIKTWWRRNNLCGILLDYIKGNKVEVVHDFLSGDYSDALRPFQDEIKKLGLKYCPHDYPRLGSASSYRRGKDINELIQTFPG